MSRPTNRLFLATTLAVTSALAGCATRASLVVPRPASPSEEAVVAPTVPPLISAPRPSAATFAGASAAPDVATLPVPVQTSNSPSARGRDRAQPWEFTLGGAGSNDESFETGSAQLAASVGYYVTEGLELSVRQNLWYADQGKGFPDIWNGSSRFAVDYVVPTRWVRPFFGVNLGYVYGDSVKESLAAAPEVGIKFFLKDDAFLQVMAEYQFLFETSDRINDAFDNGQFVYGVDLGLRF